jgi:hypothetical protein
MDYNFTGVGPTGRIVSVSEMDLEYIGDVAELFLTFLHAAGYSYVHNVVIVKDDGEEVSTQ